LAKRIKIKVVVQSQYNKATDRPNRDGKTTENLASTELNL